MTTKANWLLCGVLALATPAFAVDGRKPFENRFPSATAVGKFIGKQADAAVDLAAAQPDKWDDAAKSAEGAFDLAVAYGQAKDVDAFREAALSRRLLKQMKSLPTADRGDLLAYLSAHDELARHMAFAVRDGDDATAAYKLLDTLRKTRAKQVEALPNLAVAIAVVRDKPLVRHLNENTAKGDDPLAVFDYFASHEHQMLYGLKEMPVDLLVYVVDTTASIDELNWASSKYAGHADVGGLFFTIKYDYDYFNGKSEKKVTKQGFNLRNILQYGGVCIDQAYFSTTVGKAIGVPTAMATASSAEAGHAWVGYLKATGRSAAWNFDSGRYEEYKGVRGNVTDPQSGEPVADSSVSMIGDEIGTTVVQRQSAVAMTDAARALVGKGNDFEAPAAPAELAKPLTGVNPRKATAAAGLELVETGLKQYASYGPGWRVVADLASADELSEDQKRKWAGLVTQLCGDHHPDFALSVLEPMVATVKDAKAQSAMWDTVFNMVAKRPDLAADVRLRQAECWKKNGDLNKAGMCYQDVVQRFINAGPFALTAVHGAESVLEKTNQSAKVLDLYALAYKLVTKPGTANGSPFVTQSNWYKIREAYADKLDAAGQSAKAEQVRGDGGHTATGGK